MGKDLNGKEQGTGIMQRKDGRYVGRFVNRFGKHEEVKSRNLKELKTLMNTAIYEDTNHMNRCNTNITLDKWVTTWMEHYKDNTVCANTKRRYLEIYRLQISPTLGKMKVSDITKLQILQLLKKMNAKGYQFESRNKVRILLQDMIEKAMINDIVNKNPARGIKLGPHDKKEPRVLTPEEQSIFSECSKGTFYDNLFVVAVSTGLRPGEAYGYKMNIRTYVLIACYVCQVTPYELQESTRNTQCLWTLQRFGSCRKKAISDGENVLVVLDMVLENT